MTSTAPGNLRRDARPPIETDAAPAPGVVEVTHIRPTAVPRPWIRPLLADDERPGLEPADPAVRRFWTAVLGPGAVADLLRLTIAARHRKPLRRPLHLGQLLSEGLVHRVAGEVVVGRLVPTLSSAHQLRLKPSLRAEYRSICPD